MRKNRKLSSLKVVLKTSKPPIEAVELDEKYKVLPSLAR